MDYSIKDLASSASVMARSVFSKKKEYSLQFNCEADGLWYIDYPNRPFSHHNLLMASGVDELCAFLSEDDRQDK